MAKSKTAFFCQNCGIQSPKWVGKCSSCDEWNTYVEEVIQKSDRISELKGIKLPKNNQPNLLADIQPIQQNRIPTNSNELNRILGGGIVPGQITLLGGEPGIGKSTLMLQIAIGLGKRKVLYVSGEESGEQIKVKF